MGKRNSRLISLVYVVIASEAKQSKKIKLNENYFKNIYSYHFWIASSHPKDAPRNDGQDLIAFSC